MFPNVGVEIDTDVDVLDKCHGICADVGSCDRPSLLTNCSFIVDAKEGGLVKNLESFTVNTVRRAEDGGVARSEGVMVDQVDKLRR